MKCVLKVSEHSRNNLLERIFLLAFSLYYLFCSVPLSSSSYVTMTTTTMMFFIFVVQVKLEIVNVPEAIASQ